MHLPPLPHLPIECSCAFLPGPLGDWTRSKMDALAAEYDKAVLQLIREWNVKRDPTFAVVWCVKSLHAAFPLRKQLKYWQVS